MIGKHTRSWLQKIEMLKDIFPRISHHGATPLRTCAQVEPIDLCCPKKQPGGHCIATDDMIEKAQLPYTPNMIRILSQITCD